MRFASFVAFVQPAVGIAVFRDLGVVPERIAVELRRARRHRLPVGAHRRLGRAAAGDRRSRRGGCLSIFSQTENVCTTKLFVDLTFVAVQDPTGLQYDWKLDRAQCIELLRAYDEHRNVAGLAAFIGVEPIES